MSAPACITPVKALASGKSRLAAWFNTNQRADLVQAMLQDVQMVLQAALPRSRRIVVTSDPQVARVALALGAEALIQAADSGIAEAVRFACDAALRPGDSCIVIPSDVPLARKSDIEQLADASRHAEAVIVPDRHYQGTNALAFRLPRRIELCFGDASLARHVAAAARDGLHARVLPLESLMHDIDVPADLFTELAYREARAGQRRVAAMLRTVDAARHCQPTW